MRTTNGRRKTSFGVSGRSSELGWLGVQLRSLLALVAVVEEGSLVAAARRLGNSRSTISHQIAQLESAIGVALVVRGSGRGR